MLSVYARRVGLSVSMKRFWQRVRGQHGAFKQGEVSARAAHLTGLWDQTWPMASPLGYELRVAYSDRWVRFHSLPESKRYATVTLSTPRSAGTAELYVIAADWGSRDLAPGWSRRKPPGAWPWRIGQLDDDDPDAGRAYFWATSGMSDAEVESLLLAAADDVGRFVVGAPDLAWLYCPYDGGFDVLLPSRVERDVLKVRHAEWLPSHPGGL